MVLEIVFIYLSFFVKSGDVFEYDNFIPFPWRIREVSYWQCVDVSDVGGHDVRWEPGSVCYILNNRTTYVEILLWKILNIQ